MPSPVDNTRAAQHAEGKNHRKRLPREAYDILNSHFHDVTEWPSESERVQLAGIVRCIQGCEHYTPVHVYRYFANLRWRKRNASDNTQSSDNDGARKLEMLLQETPNPQPAVAQIWAEKLGNGMTVEDVLTYMMLHPRLDRSAVEVPPPHAATKNNPSLLTADTAVAQRSWPTPLNPYTSSSVSGLKEPLSSPPAPTATSSDISKAGVSVKSDVGSCETASPSADVHHPKSELEDLPVAVPSSSDTARCGPGSDSRGSMALSYFGFDTRGLADLLRSALESSPEPSSDTERYPKTYAELAQWLREQDDGSLLRPPDLSQVVTNAPKSMETTSMTC